MIECIHINCNQPSSHGLCDGHRKLLVDDESIALVCWECSTIEAILVRKEVITMFSVDEIQMKKYVYVEKCHLCNGGESKLITKRNIGGFVL